ncbi:MULTISPECIES: PPC domain-containing DNA-binding protein [Anaerostipes]|uniref:PPC domain-containing DNA-binding protein n=1 Tax=Anaerostipes TaxID=207244 RepID=UPI0009513715|nr:PPC domain-containing DNA-binding protein [Anaerostipes sp. 494a]OLR59574.1 DNA-binding protein [Anaerostipes sp. 494a]
MEYRKFDDHYVIRLDRGEEIVAKLKEVAQKEGIKLAYLTGIGAVGKVTAGVFDTKEKEFKGHTWEGDLEVVSIGGNINTMNGETYAHFHISIADEEGHVYGGHLTEAVISGTGEMVLTEIKGNVDREYDEEIGLNLFKF